MLTTLQLDSGQKHNLTPPPAVWVTCRILMFRSSSPLDGPMSIGPSATFFGGGAPPASPAGRLAAMTTQRRLLGSGVYHVSSNVGVAFRRVTRRNKRKETEVYKRFHVFFVWDREFEPWIKKLCLATELPTSRRGLSGWDVS